MVALDMIHLRRNVIFDGNALFGAGIRCIVDQSKCTFNIRLFRIDAHGRFVQCLHLFDIEDDAKRAGSVIAILSAHDIGGNTSAMVKVAMARCV